MNKKNSVFTGLIFLLALCSCSSEMTAEKEIEDRLMLQQECWNAGDLECFMIGYWQSDSLVFMGKNGPIYGYVNTLERYKKDYPDRASMGNLKFDIIRISQVSAQVYFVAGKYHLKRDIGDVEGYFTLVWKKVGGDWTIVADHSSASN